MLKSIADALLVFGPFGALLIGFLDAAGLPLPEVLDFWLLTLAIRDPDRAYFAAALGVIGSAAGNYALFRAARYGGDRFFKTAAGGKGDEFSRWFSRYGLTVLFVPAVVPLIPLPMKVFVISAGTLRTSTIRFLAVIIVARMLRYFGEAYAGARLRQNAPGFLIDNAWGIAGAVSVAVLLLVACMKWRAWRRAEAL